MFSELNHPEDKLQLGSGWGVGGSKKCYFRNCKRGFFGGKKNKTSVGRVSGLSGNCKTNCHALPL